jgi:guanylate kinase
MWNKDLLEKVPRGRLFIICAPAGAGKTTLVKQLLETFPNLKTSLSYTTRTPRADEINGREYHFVSKDIFLQKKARGEFLETIELHGNFYGTSKTEIESLLASGNHVLLAIDTRGAFALQKIFDPILVFLKAPSPEILRERLIQRGSEDLKNLEQRLEWAKKEMTEEKKFHYSVINDSLEKALTVLACILVAETHKTK